MLRRAEEGHPGGLAVLGQVQEAFLDLITADKSRSLGVATGEWARLLEGAVAILAPQPRTPSLGDPCVVPSDPPWRWWEPWPGA